MIVLCNSFFTIQAVIMKQNVAYNTVNHRLRMLSQAKLNYTDSASVTYATIKQPEEDSDEHTALYEELN